jgi:hypothetical protein
MSSANDNEWQEYKCKETGDYYYINLVTKERCEADNRPQWYMPAGSGADEHIGVTLLRTDRWNRNPHEKPSNTLKMVNVAVLLVCLGGLGYQMYEHRGLSDEQVEELAKQKEAQAAKQREHQLRERRKGREQTEHHFLAMAGMRRTPPPNRVDEQDQRDQVK